MVLFCFLDVNMKIFTLVLLDMAYKSSKFPGYGGPLFDDLVEVLFML